MKNLLFRDDESLIGSNWYYLEKKLFIFPLLLSFIGLLAIYSLIGTEYSIALLFKHTVFLLFSLSILFFFSLIPINNLRKILNIIAISFLLLLALVPLLGYEVKGATRWINLKFFSIQPSEILKGPILCLFSWFCYLFIKTGKSLYMFLFILIILFVSALLLLQPDIGTLMLYLSSFFLLIILYLRNIKLFFILGFFGALLLAFAYFTFDHVSLRIDKFFSSESSPQVARSLSAIIGGGFFGVGLGEGQLKYSIPESHNDFIFAILIEEFGIFFGLFIALLYPIFFFLIKQILKSQPNLFIQNTTFSLCFILCIQAFINIGSSIDLIPPTGMTLPFISYGGSSMLSYAIIFGTLINFSKNEKNSLSNTS